jgi:hypothetical protein
MPCNRQNDRLPGLYVGIDLGAGSGAKIGIFDETRTLRAQAFLPVAAYGASGPALADALAAATRSALSAPACEASRPVSVGLAAPGLFRSDGSFLHIANLPFLTDVNLARLLAERLQTRTAAINDADAGALAEWSREGSALLYWVLGGGWGGAWVDESGRVLFAPLDWDGRDASLHPTNEPGHSIGLDIAELDRLFHTQGGSFAQFAAVCAASGAQRSLSGPDGRSDCVRAELLVSGPGRWRIFRALTLNEPAWQRLPVAQRTALEKQESAGPVLNLLACERFPQAVATDTIFAQAMALAGGVLLERARQDGCAADIPVILGGKPSRAFSSFGEPLRVALRQQGFRGPLRLSVFEREGRNANMAGAAFIP